MRGAATTRYAIEDELVSAADPHRVMARLRDATTWPQWQSEIISADGSHEVEQGDEIFGVARLVGFRVEGRSHAVEVEDHIFAEDVIVGVRMQVTYTIEPSANGTRITRRLEANLPRGVLGSMLSVTLRWKLRRMQKRVLVTLARQLEAEPSS